MLEANIAAIDKAHAEVQAYCNYAHGHFWVGGSASSFTAIAGIFGAVMLPFLAVILVNPGSNPRDQLKKTAAIRAPTLILAAFLMEIMAAYFFAVIAGDNSCIR